MTRQNILLIFILISFPAFGTNCYTNCKGRFPKWYQEWDLRRCQVEKQRACLEKSSLPQKVDLFEFEPKIRDISDKLVSEFLESGYVVSRDPKNRALHGGDSVLFSMLALSALSCDQGEEIREAILNSIDKRGGAILRIDPLPTSYRGNETSRDMETGAMFGFALRSLKCLNERESFRQAWRKHQQFIHSNNGKLYSGSNNNFDRTLALRHVGELLSHRLDHTPKPSLFSFHEFQSALIANSFGIKVSHKACYPLHLNTLMIILSDYLGMPINEFTKREFCAQTRGMGLALTDWMCNRLDVKAYLKDFDFTKNHYVHQRCNYEGNDLKVGERSANVDYLLLYALASKN